MNSSVMEAPVQRGENPVPVREVRPEAPTSAPATGWKEQNRLSPFGRLVGWLFILTVTGALAFGWSMRDTGYLSAEEGAGYWLGVAGALMMAGAILYPIRKRNGPVMRHLGAVRHWFRAHMLKGILGPLCIVFHANFQLGSLNSTVALGTMAMVVASGLFGRYVYTKVHYGLYGSLMNLSSLGRDLTQSMEQLSADCPYAPAVAEKLKKYEAGTLSPGWGFVGRIGCFLFLGLSVRWTRMRVGAVLSRSLKHRRERLAWSRSEWKHQRTTAFNDLDTYLSAIRRVVEFRFYERLFSLWHPLHMPLFLLLMGAGLVHVAAVHLY